MIRATPATEPDGLKKELKRGEVLKPCRCPICGKVVPLGKYRPFCSKRCADIDLGNWFDESYRVEAEEIDDQDIEALEELISRDDED